jgi:AraC-like DNA-binding protein
LCQKATRLTIALKRDYWYIFAMATNATTVEATGWEEIRWPIALGTPPDFVSVGIGLHGRQGPIDRYLLPDLWCLHLYTYSATLLLGKQTFPIRPGFAGLIPPNMPTEYRYRGVSQHLFVHFRWSTNAQATGESAERIPAMQDMGAEFARYYGQLERVVRGVGRAPSRAQSCVWDILCELCDRQDARPTDAPDAHPAVRAAVSLIELRLAEPLSVAQLADECHISYSYLGRLFQEAYGTTVVGYIRARRMQRAAHLLNQSTLPIKVIAAAVGIPDLHLFNKTVRHTLGASPRAIRQSRIE